MGPPLISGGNVRSARDATEPMMASMGPPLISGGNSDRLGTAPRRLGKASMGPPLISGGNESGADAR